MAISCPALVIEPYSRAVVVGEEGIPVSESLELEIGAQTRAAMSVHERMPTISALLEDLAAEVGAASSGFRGAAAGGLAEALEAWFTTAGAIPERLAAYAASLASVDQRTATSEDRSSQGYTTLQDRMGSGR